MSVLAACLTDHSTNGARDGAALPHRTLAEAAALADRLKLPNAAHATGPGFGVYLADHFPFDGALERPLQRIGQGRWNARIVTLDDARSVVGLTLDPDGGVVSLAHCAAAPLRIVRSGDGIAFGTIAPAGEAPSHLAPEDLVSLLEFGGSPFAGDAADWVLPGSQVYIGLRGIRRHALPEPEDRLEDWLGRVVRGQRAPCVVAVTGSLQSLRLAERVADATGDAALAYFGWPLDDRSTQLGAFAEALASGLILAQPSVFAFTRALPELLTGLPMPVADPRLLRLRYLASRLAPATRLLLTAPQATAAHRIDAGVVLRGGDLGYIRAAIARRHYRRLPGRAFGTQAIAADHLRSALHGVATAMGRDGVLTLIAPDDVPSESQTAADRCHATLPASPQITETDYLLQAWIEDTDTVLDGLMTLDGPVVIDPDAARSLLASPLDDPSERQLAWRLRILSAWVRANQPMPV